MMPSQSPLQSAAFDAPAPSLMPFTEELLGAAVFDLNGLPREYFVNREAVDDLRWVQVIFQSLGLQSLLAASLRLEGFRHIVIDSDDCSAVVVRQKRGYISVLLQRQGSTPLSKAAIQWIQDLEPEQLLQEERLRRV